MLRRDGFVSLDAGANAGTLLTEPFTLTGDKLFVNSFGHKNGSLRVDVLATNQKVLARSSALTGDQLRGEVRWSQNDIAKLKGKTVQLRFTLNDSNLYSYWLKD